MPRGGNKKGKSKPQRWSPHLMETSAALVFSHFCSLRRPPTPSSGRFAEGAPRRTAGEQGFGKLVARPYLPFLAFVPTIGGTRRVGCLHSTRKPGAAS